MSVEELRSLLRAGFFETHHGVTARFAENQCRSDLSAA
jgi:hypothetical protein